MRPMNRGKLWGSIPRRTSCSEHSLLNQDSSTEPPSTELLGCKGLSGCKLALVVGRMDQAYLPGRQNPRATRRRAEHRDSRRRPQYDERHTLNGRVACSRPLHPKHLWPPRRFYPARLSRSWTICDACLGSRSYCAAHSIAWFASLIR